MITWRYYTPSAGSIWTAPNAISHICLSSGPGGQCLGKDWTSNVDLSPADVLRDIGSCKLRSVSWVVPTGANSDHARVNDGGGPSWVAAIVNAIGSSIGLRQQRRMLAKHRCYHHVGRLGRLVRSRDAYYPRACHQGDYQYGFRVPLVVVSSLHWRQAAAITNATISAAFCGSSNTISA